MSLRKGIINQTRYYEKLCRTPHHEGTAELASDPIKAPRLPAKWRKLAQQRCDDAAERLTPARLAAYAELLTHKQPASAYELIALLEKRQERKIAPLTVYRHLDFLLRVGLIHRLETTQQYLICDHPEHTHESQYLLCSSCGNVDEVESKRLETLLSKIADQNGFQPQNTVVEIKGLCGSCVGAGAG